MNLKCGLAIVCRLATFSNVGRLVRDKGVFELLDAYARLETGAPLQCWFGVRWQWF